jgi:hypothetical protein
MLDLITEKQDEKQKQASNKIENKSSGILFYGRN